MRDGIAKVMGSLALVVFMAQGRSTLSQTATAVGKLDLKQLNGTWYEVARYPNKREDKRCAGNAMMLVAPGDKARSVQVVYACKTKPGYTDARNVDGKAADKLGDGKLKFGFWPLYQKLWVLDIAPDGAWLLLGNPNHKDLWIYAKATSLPNDVLTQMKAEATAGGFDMAKLMMSVQGLTEQQ